MAYWYINYGDGSTTGYYSVIPWSATIGKTVGNMVRQLAVPAIGSERCFVCIVTGNTGATEPTWVLTTGAKTVDGGVTWMECTGRTGTNGGGNLTTQWAASLGVVTLGTQIRGAGNHTTSLMICVTAGNVGTTEPTWPTAAGGAIITDGAAQWTCLGLTTNFTPFQAPFARIATAFTFRAAGDVQFVADNHAETQATAITINCTLPPSRTYCINRTVSNPGAADVRTTASVTCTAASGASYNIGGTGYIYGVQFLATLNAVTTPIIQNAAGVLNFEACLFSAWTLIAMGNNPPNLNGYCNFNNTSVRWIAPTVTARLRINYGTFTWRNSQAIGAGGAAAPLYLFSSTAASIINCEGVNFNCAGATAIIEGVAASSRIMLNGCQYPTGTTPVMTTQAASGWYVDTIQTDSAINYARSERYRYNTSQFISSTVTRASGAIDGVTPISWRIVPGGLQIGRPFQSTPIAIWNARTGVAITATVEMLVDGVTLDNSQIWLEAVYYGSATSPLASFANTAVASAMDVGVVYPISTATWTMPGIAHPILQNMSITITPQYIGFVVIYVMVAAYQSNVTNIYIDPKVVVS